MSTASLVPAESVIPSEIVDNRILLIRGQKVLLSTHLAQLYEVENRVLMQAVRRNEDRFPADFMFQLTEEEWQRLRSQIVTLDKDSGRGRHAKYLPYAFTEQGVAMLSSVLRSPRAAPLWGGLPVRGGAPLRLLPRRAP